MNITVGELKVHLAGINDRTFIRLVVMDDEARDIKMEGFLDYIIKPEKKNDSLQLYAGGEALIG